jgi:predicted restriction endonuclease
MYKAKNNPMFGKPRLDLIRLNKSKQHIETVAEFHRGRKRTEETKKLIGVKSRASRLAQRWWKDLDNPMKLPNWDNKRDYGQPLSRKIRKQVLERDNYTCIVCMIKFEPKDLHTHHKIPRRKKGSDDMDNLITVCKTCHVILDYEIIKQEKQIADKH